MRIRTMSAALILATALPAGAAEPARPGIENLKWMAGCWAAVDGESGSGEIWMPPAGGAMLGMSRTIKSGRMTAWEFVQIAQHADGSIEYIAKPHNQTKASFRLIASEAKSVTFENPTHDFPQRIIYKMRDDGVLHARIEGTMDGKPQGVDYPLKRQACE